MRRFLEFVFEPVLAHRRTLVAMNVLYWGTMALGMAATLVDRSLQPALTRNVVEGLSPSGSLGPLVKAYTEGQLAQAILLTFVVNLFLGSLVEITLLSAIIPFFGLLMGMIRAVMWGILFSPFGVSEIGIGPQIWPHVITIVVEGEAYVLAVVGVWLWWSRVVQTGGERWQSWRRGFALQSRVYLGVALLLAIAAIWEAFEVIYLIPR